MYKINFKLLALLLILIGGNAYGQVAFNPFTQNIHFSPEPSASGFVCGSSQNIVFSAGLTTANDAMMWQTQPLKIMICVSGFTFSGPASGNVSGSYASNFDWSYDPMAPNCIIGVQNQTLKGTGGNPIVPATASSGEIVVKVVVPSTSPLGTVLSADVTLQVPTYMQQYNSVPDDNEATQTQSYCALIAKGTIYRDDSNDEVVNGIPVASASEQALFAHLVGAEQKVLEVAKVGSNGQYAFSHVDVNKSYQILLSTLEGTVGESAPNAQLPEKWIFTGECDRTGNDGNANGVIDLDITNFSKEEVNFGIRDTRNAAPQLVLKNFFVSEYNCTGLLSWTTSTEFNTSHVEIYRKESGMNGFTKIATVQSAGASNEEKIYSYVDNEVNSDKQYDYQLAFIGINGKFAQSDIKSLALDCKHSNNTVNIFPNPAISELNVLFVTEGDGVTVDFEIVDITGRSVASQSSVLKSGANVITFDVKALDAGNYLVHYKDQSTLNKGSLKFTKK